MALGDEDLLDPDKYPTYYADLVEDDEVSTDATAVPQVVRSGLKPSGLGKAFSGWYYLTSGDAPVGWQIVNSRFKLEGDRSCGAWAECTEVSRTYNHVVWQFRLQGHDESAPYVRYSEGVLTYDLVPLPTGSGVAG